RPVSSSNRTSDRNLAVDGDVFMVRLLKIMIETSGRAAQNTETMRGCIRKSMLKAVWNNRYCSLSSVPPLCPLCLCGEFLTVFHHRDTEITKAAQGVELGRSA